MKELGKNGIGLIVGFLFAFWHLLWSLLVALGLAQVFMDWVYALHFLNNPFVVSNFSAVTAVTLVALTFVIGYVMGWLFVYVWETKRKKK